MRRSREDRFLFLTENIVASDARSSCCRRCFKNHGNYVISLGNVCRWLGQQAEALGVEIFPGFPAADVLYDDNGAVKGVVTGDMGVDRDGKPTDAYQPGMELHGKYTLLRRRLPRPSRPPARRTHFKLRDGADPQVYGIGLKELWEIKPERHQTGPRHAHRRLAAREPTPTAARSSITWRTTWSRSASSSASATPIPT